MRSIIFLNTSICYQQIRLEAYDWSQYLVPEDWQSGLIDYLYQRQDLLEVSRQLSRQKMEDEFKRHLGDNATAQQQKLEKLLVQIEAVVNQRVIHPSIYYDPQRDDAQISTSLLEELSKCFNGLVERAEVIWTNLMLSRDLSGLLERFRREIVDAEARAAIINIDPGMQVHAHARFYIAAAELGYGVTAVKSYYIDSTPGDRELIKKAFVKRFTPLLIIEYIETCLRSELQERGYQAADKGLDFNAATRDWLPLINNMLQYEGGVHDYCRFNEELGIIYDLDWGKIRVKLANLLIEQGYLYTNNSAISQEFIHPLSNEPSFYLTILPDLDNEKEMAYWCVTAHSAMLNTFYYALSQEDRIRFFLTLFQVPGSVFLKNILTYYLDEDKTTHQYLLLKNGPDTVFYWACENAYIDVVYTHFKAVEIDKIALKTLLLAGNLIAGEARAFQIVCEKGHLEVVNAFLDAVKDHKMILKAMLLTAQAQDGPAIPLRLACRARNTAVVKMLLEAANDDEVLLTEMIMAADPYFGPARGFLLSCAAGDVDTVKVLLDAVKNSVTRKAMVLAGNSTFGPAFAFQMACQRGRSEVVHALLEAFKEDKETLKVLLLAVHPEYGGAWGLVSACANNHIEVIKLLLAAAKEDKELLKAMLLAGHSESGLAGAFKWACEYGRIEAVQLLLEAANVDMETFKTMLLCASSGAGPGIAFRLACHKSHTQVINAVLNAVENNDMLFFFCAHMSQYIDSKVWKVICSYVAAVPERHVAFLMQLRPNMHLLNCFLDMWTLPEQKSSIVTYMVEKIAAKQNLNTSVMKSYYARHAGFFSLTRMRMQAQTDLDAVILLKQLQTEASKSFSNAATRTLLELYRSAMNEPNDTPVIEGARI